MIHLLENPLFKELIQYLTFIGLILVCYGLVCFVYFIKFTLENYKIDKKHYKSLKRWNKAQANIQLYEEEYTKTLTTCINKLEEYKNFFESYLSIGWVYYMLF